MIFKFMAFVFEIIVPYLFYNNFSFVDLKAFWNMFGILQFGEVNHKKFLIDFSQQCCL